MARLFDDASTEHLIASGTPISDFPFTLAYWGYTDTNAIQEAGITLYDSGAAKRINLRHQGSSDDIRYEIQGTSANPFLESTANFSINTWQHACGVSAASNDHRVYLDGGNKDTSSTDTGALYSYDVVYIGVLDGSNFPFSGRIAEVALWDAALTDAEVAILAAGYAPPFVRPQSLVAYWPLIRDEDQDRVGGFDMTPINTPTVATHPPIIYPATPYIVVPSGAAPAANIPEFMHHYQQQLQAG